MNSKLIRITAGLALIALATGCAQLPTSGEVVKAPAVSAQNGNLVQRAPEPIKGASPLQIIRGFLQACAAGTYDNYVGARKFLTANAGAKWQPETEISVLEDEEGLILKEVSGSDSQQVVGSGTLTMKVDTSGVSHTTTEPIETKFYLQKSGDEWRISRLPDGVLLPKADFNNSFTRWPVYFLSLDGHSLVSDPRWVARSRMTEQLSKYLLAGPSPSLNDTVETAFRSRNPGKDLVRLESSQVTINLPEMVENLSGAQINELYRQFQATLNGVDNISNVVLATPNKEFPAPTRNANSNTMKSSNNAVLGMINGEIVEQAESYSKVLVDRKSAGNGQLSWPVTGTGTDAPLVANQNDNSLVMLRRGKEPQALYTNQNLRIPVVDSRGWIWTGSKADSVTLPVVDVEGNQASVSTPWVDGSELLFLTVNPEGSRVLAVLRNQSQYRVELLAVKRAKDGKPLSLVESITIWYDQLKVRSAVWLDNMNAAFLTSGELAEVIVVPVNSYLEYLDAPIDGEYLVGNPPNGVVQIVTKETDRLNRVGNIWRRVSTGLLFPSYPG